MEKNISEEAGTLGSLLRLPYERLRETIYHRLEEGGYPEVRPAHSSVFRHILPGGSRLTELAERAGITKQSMAYLVGGLQEAGYLALEADPDDGRAKRVRLTARGLECQRQLVTLSVEVEGELARCMGQDKLQRLRRLLQDMAQELRAE